MDKEGTGKGAAAAKATIAEIRRIKNAVVAVGQNITMNEFDRWLKELSGVPSADWVRWVHTKFMLVDPLSEDPVVITGSANFSDPSIDTNHENMLVIRGDTRVADIYLGEFMRQFTSYAYRDAAKAAAQGSDPSSFRPQDLFTDNSWIHRYEGAGTSGELRGCTFPGSRIAPHLTEHARQERPSWIADRFLVPAIGSRGPGRRSSFVKLVRCSTAADVDRRHVIVGSTDAGAGARSCDQQVAERTVACDPTASVNHRGPIYFLRVDSIDWKK
jgi:hypothetical protein